MFPDGVEVGSAPFVEQDEDRGTLLIRGVQEVDGGQYSCVASSSAGTASGTVSLDVGGETAHHCVLSKLSCQSNSHTKKCTLLSTAEPLFSEAPVDVTANIGENVTLPCTARGFPQPTLTWHREGGREIFTRTDSHSKTTQLENGHLLIQGEQSMK